MSIEFIGIAATAPHSETEIASGPAEPVQPGYLDELARAHEEAAFDRVLVAHSSASPDGFTVAPGSACRSGPFWGPPRNWPGKRAHRILEATESPGSPAAQFRGWRGANGQPENTGSQRLLAAAAQGDLHDRALWTATARACGSGGNSTALVGTPGTVAQALLDYVDIGVSALLIRGYDPLEDATDYGRELIPAVRAEVARRDAAAAQAGAEAELAGRP